MPIEVEAPDGSIVEFPDGTPDEEMARAMRKTFGMQPQRGFLVPLMTDETGETSLAVPGILYQPYQAFKSLLERGGYQPGTEDVEGVQLALEAGGMAAPGTAFFARPGSMGARAVRNVRGDVPPPPPGGRLPTATEAAQEMGIALPRAAVSESQFTTGLSDLVKEVPTVVQNPIRKASERALQQIGERESQVLERALSGYDLEAAGGVTPAFDFRQGLRGSKTAEEAAEAAAGLEAARPAKAAPGPSEGQQGPFRIITPDQSMEIEAEPMLVELSDLKLAGGRFQPRDRQRPEYMQEVRERATRLDPEQLRPSRVADSGPPIILDDGTIISGNGRALSIAEVYRDPQLRAQAEAYRASLGPEAAKMKQPVLVMRARGLADDDAARFADLANRSRIAQMSATERAARDAASLGPEGMALYQGGDFTAPQNRDFLRAFMERAVTAAERPSVSSGGQLTQEGITRMRNAVLAAAYEDPATIARMVESADDNIRNITGALTDAASLIAGLKADIRAGVVKADMDPTGNLLEAVRLIADLRNRGVSPANYFAQLDAFSTLDPRTAAWLRAFYNEDLTRPISRQKMTQVLRAYVDEAVKHSEGGFFPDPTTQEDVLNVATRAARAEPDAAAGAVGDGAGAGLRESGRENLGQEPAGSVSDAVRGGLDDAGRQPEAARVIDAAEAERLASERLIEARIQQMADILGMKEGQIAVEDLFNRIAEVATTRGGADRINTAKLAANAASPGLWENHVVPAVLARLGRSKDGTWSLQAFADSYRRMHDNARKALFQSPRRRNLKTELDNLVAIAEKVPRLEQLAKGELEEMLAKVPILGNFARWSVSGWVGQVLTHGGLAGVGGVKSLAVPAAGWAIAKILSRDVTAKSFGRYLSSLFRLIEGPNRRNQVAFQIVARQFAADLLREAAGEVSREDIKELGDRLAGEVGPDEARSYPPGMMRLGGPKPDEQEEPGALETAADYAGRGLAVVDLYTGGILSALAGLNPFVGFRRVMEARERALEGVPRDIKAAATEPFNPVMAVFAGPKIAQKLWDQGVKGPKRAIELAEALEKKGVSREEIYKQTSKLLKDTPYAGVSKDASGKWRFEISDEGLEIEPGVGFGKVRHPELQKGLQDDFRDVRSVIHTGAPVRGRFGQFDFIEDERGRLVPIRSLEASGRDIDETRRVVAHELDHLVQYEEGFSRGGSPADIMPRDELMRAESPISSTGRRKAVGPGRATDLPEPRRYPGRVISLGPGDLPAVEQYARAVSRLSADQRAALPSVDEYEALVDQVRNGRYPHIRTNAYEQILAATRALEHDQAVNTYMRLGGEASAREAAERLPLTAAERRATPPELYADRIEGGRIAGIGENHPGVDPQMMPDTETIARMPETRALAEKVFSQLAKKAKGQSDAELWEAAYASAIADMQRRIEEKGLKSASKRIDRKIGTMSRDKIDRIIRERNARDQRAGRFNVKYRTDDL